MNTSRCPVIAVKLVLALNQLVRVEIVAIFHAVNAKATAWHIARIIEVTDRIFDYKPCSCICAALFSVADAAIGFVAFRIKARWFAFFRKVIGTAMCNPSKALA